MNNKNWYIVTDLAAFVDKSRALVFNSFGKQQMTNYDEIGIDTILETEKEEFDKIIPHQDSLLIAKEILRKQKNKTTSNTRYLVSDNLYKKFIESLNERMIGNILNGLVNRGLVDIAFDEEANDFLFWCVDNENKDKKPKTDRN